MIRTVSLLGALLLALYPASTVLAQPEPIRFGRVSAEDFQLAPQVPDTNATAIVLADYGDTYFEPGGEVTFLRHRRIKILTEAGFDWGTHSITYYAGRGSRQSVRDLRAQAYTLQPDGTVDVHRLDRRSTFEENLDGEYKRIRFTLPALAPGTIVEYRYTIMSPNAMYAPDWDFQSSEPTLWSEYRFNVPAGYEYVRATTGVMNFFAQESNRTHFRGRPAVQHRWVMKEVPALREEPFMTALSDYRARMRFQLASYTVGGVPRRVLSSWPELAKELMEGPFGRHLRASREAREAAADATRGLTSDHDKMVALYDYVRQTIRFSGLVSVFPDQDGRQVLRTRSGSSPEIALLLTAMLREQGLTANPVLISTRSHGRVFDVYPLVSQFNDMIVHVQTSDGEYLLDATDEHRPHTLLPPAVLNGRGWLVSERDQRWVPIPATGMLARGTEIRAALAPSGALTGRILSRNDGYAAVEMRDHLAADFDRHKFVRDVVFAGVDDVEVRDPVVHDAQASSGRIGVETDFTMEQFAQPAGDLLFFNPVVVSRYDSNPLRMPERSFPVDYAYPRTHAYELRLSLPEGYRLLEGAPQHNIRHPKGGAAYRRFLRMEDDVLVVESILQLTRVTFEPSEYADLREFYARIVAAEAEQVVLTRAQAPEPAAPEPAAPGEGAGR